MTGCALLIGFSLGLFHYGLLGWLCFLTGREAGWKAYLAPVTLVFRCLATAGALAYLSLWGVFFLAHGCFGFFLARILTTLMMTVLIPAEKKHGY